MRRVGLLPLLGLAACGTATGPDGFALEFAVSSRMVTHGVPVTFTLRVTNLTGSTKVLRGNACLFDWELVEAHQVRACADLLVTESFEPLQTRTYTFPWDGYLYDIEGRPVAANPGTYNARGVVNALEGQGASPTVEVEVRAPDVPSG